MGCEMDRKIVWSLLFAASTSVLMFTILSLRSFPVPTIVLACYPALGGALAFYVSHTAPRSGTMLRLECGAVAAAALIPFFGLVYFPLFEWLLDGPEIRTLADTAPATPSDQLFVLGILSLFLWWRLERQLRTLRLKAA